MPIAADSDSECEESSRTWLCITRPSVCEASYEVPTNVETSENGHPIYDIAPTNPLKLESVTSRNGLHHSAESFQFSEEVPINKATSLTGKRKERSPSPSN